MNMGYLDFGCLVLPHRNLFNKLLQVFLRFFRFTHVNSWNKLIENHTTKVVMCTFNVLGNVCIVCLIYHVYRRRSKWYCFIMVGYKLRNNSEIKLKEFIVKLPVLKNNYY